MSSIHGPGWCRYSTEKCLPDIHLPFVYVVFLSISPIWRIGETNPLGKTSKILFWIVMPTFGKSCHRPWLHGLQSQVSQQCKCPNAHRLSMCLVICGLKNTEFSDKGAIWFMEQTLAAAIWFDNCFDKQSSITLVTKSALKIHTRDLARFFLSGPVLELLNKYLNFGPRISLSRWCQLIWQATSCKYGPIICCQITGFVIPKHNYCCFKMLHMYM